MLLQFVVNGIIAGSLIAIMGMGFWFIYRSTNIFHIAHGAVYTASAYIFYTFYTSKDNPLLLSLFGSLISGALLGLGMYFVVYRPLEKKNASVGVKFISSLAIYILVVNIIALIYGNETKILSEGISDSISFGNIILTRVQLYQFLSLLILFIISYAFVHMTKIGSEIKAIGDNLELFKAIGLDERWVKGMVFIIGSAMAGIASVLNLCCSRR